MKIISQLLLALSFTAATGCVIAPPGYHRGYYGPRVGVVVPAPVVVVRPYYYPYAYPYYR